MEDLIRKAFSFMCHLYFAVSVGVLLMLVVTVVTGTDVGWRK